MFFSIGHSTRTSAQLIKILRDEGAGALIDVRSHPTSKWPQWRKEAMEIGLPRVGIEYIWMPGLGGWTKEYVEDLPRALREQIEAAGVDLSAYTKGYFPKQRISKKTTPDPDNPAWTSVGFADYQHFQRTEWFRRDLETLSQLGHKNPTLCCAEILWFKCHRSMVADALLYATDGEAKVLHIGANAHAVNHARFYEDRLKRYESAVLENWSRWWDQQDPQP